MLCASSVPSRDLLCISNDGRAVRLKNIVFVVILFSQIIIFICCRYYWAYRLGGPKWGPFASWTAGWCNLLGQIAGVASGRYIYVVYLIKYSFCYDDSYHRQSSIIRWLFWGTSGCEYSLSYKQLYSQFWRVLGSVWRHFGVGRHRKYVLWDTTHLTLLYICDMALCWRDDNRHLDDFNCSDIAITCLCTNKFRKWYFFLNVYSLIVYHILTPCTYVCTETNFSSSAYVGLIGLLFAASTFTGYDTAAHVAEETTQSHKSSKDYTFDNTYIYIYSYKYIIVRF